MSQNTQHDNKFEPVRDEEIRSIIVSAAKLNARIQLWTEGQKYACSGKVLRAIEGGEYTYFTVPRETDTADFEKNLRGAGIEEVLVSLHLPTDLLYFKAQLRRSDAVSIQFKVLSPMFKLQRRRALRVPFAPTEAPKVLLRLSADDHVPIHGKLLNLSEGGAGVILEKEADFQRLPKGKQVAKIIIGLEPILIECEAEVKHTQEMPPTSRMKRHYKVGLMFVGLNPIVRDQVYRYVFEESTRFLGRI